MGNTVDRVTTIVLGDKSGGGKNVILPGDDVFLVKDGKRTSILSKVETVNDDMITLVNDSTNVYIAKDLDVIMNEEYQIRRSMYKLLKEYISECKSHQVSPNQKILDVYSAAVKAGRVVYELHLNGEELSDADVVPICPLLKKNSGIEVLDLSSNNLGPISCVHLEDALTHSSDILELNLSNNPLMEKGAEHISNMLQYNRSLSCLHIGNSKIGKNAVKRIASSLKANPHSKVFKLDVSRNGARDEEVEAFYDLVQTNKTLCFIQFQPPFEDTPETTDDNSKKDNDKQQDITAAATMQRNNNNNNGQQETHKQASSDSILDDNFDASTSLSSISQQPTARTINNNDDNNNNNTLPQQQQQQQDYSNITDGNKSSWLSNEGWLKYALLQDKLGENQQLRRQMMADIDEIVGASKAGSTTTTTTITTTTTDFSAILDKISYKLYTARRLSMKMVHTLDKAFIVDDGPSSTTTTTAEDVSASGGGMDHDATTMNFDEWRARCELRRKWKQLAAVQSMFVERELSGGNSNSNSNSNSKGKGKGKGNPKANNSSNKRSDEEEDEDWVMVGAEDLGLYNNIARRGTPSGESKKTGANKKTKSTAAKANSSNSRKTGASNSAAKSEEEEEEEEAEAAAAGINQINLE